MHPFTSNSSRALVVSTLVLAMSALLAGCESVGGTTKANADGLPTGSVYFGNEYGSDQAALAPQPALQPQAF